MNRCLNNIIIICLFLLNIQNVWAAKLAIVIDDFGYRKHNEEQIISISSNITIAVLPNSPNAKKIATLAHEHGNDVIIHLPMAPMGKQPLEKDTLFPDMNENQIQDIIHNAVEQVPYAIGINNHMGSLMTSNLKGMEYVMKAMSNYSMFFLDSKTIAKTQIEKAASNYNIPVVKRDIFLDDERKESAIAHQFDLAVQVARKNGSAIAIGHPHPETINVLRNKLANLPADVELTKVSHLITIKPSLSEPKIITIKSIIEKYKKRINEIYQIYISTEK